MRTDAPWVLVASHSTDSGKLANRLAALTDSGMRVSYVRHELRQMDVSQLADLLAAAKDNAEKRDPKYAELLLCISMALADESCEEMRRSLADLLDARGKGELARSLRQVTVDVSEDTPRVPDFGLGRPLALGERKTLARRNDRNLITRVLRDPQPSVIRILLENPGLTESDVVRLCASRPIVPEIQREIFTSRRWIVRYRVKMAIVLNPYTPLDVALQIAPHLNKQDLRRVAASEDLSTELRETCHRRGTRRRRTRNDDRPPDDE